MDRVFESNAINTPPAYPSVPARGYATDGDLGNSTPPTTPGAWWYHMITEELINAIGGISGIVFDGSNTHQLRDALIAAYGAGGVTGSPAVHLSDFTGSSQSLSSSGFQRLPGGLIFQWGSGTDAGTAVHNTFGITFPNACLNVQLTHRSDQLNRGVFECPVVDIAPTATGYYAYNGNGSLQPHFYTAIGY